MTDMPIYYASELNPDTCLNIAMFLFATRRNSKLTITEAAVRTGLSVKDVDELETQAGQYDFAKNREAVGFIQEKAADVGKEFETNAQNAGRQIF